MRTIFTLLHRWLGLFIALFLFIAGITGAIIAWDHELDAWLAPEFYHSPLQEQVAFTPLQLAAQFEARHPGISITFMPLALRPSEALSAMVEARKTDIDQEPKALPYSQIALNPYTAEIQAKRLWGEVSFTRENLLPFLYKLHYSLHLDQTSLQIGTLLMGIIGIVWVLDCFIALSISFPSRAQWRKSFAFRWSSSSHKITFDLHRSGGVWVWLLLLMMAITSVSMNLGPQVTRPIVSLFSTLTPSPFEVKTPEPVLALAPVLNREAIVALAAAQARTESIQAPIGGIFYSSLVNIYGVGFYAPGMGHGDMGLGNPWLYFDGKTGAYLGGSIPGQGSAGDIFMQLQFPLHSGRILGTTGRVLVTLLGLTIATLSVTGIIIWARKRKSRYVTRIAKHSANSNLIPSIE